jgi:hypothetical protein
MYRPKFEPEHVPITSLERYRYANPLRSNICLFNPTNDMPQIITVNWWFLIRSIYYLHILGEGSEMWRRVVW